MVAASTALSGMESSDNDTDDGSDITGVALRQPCQLRAAGGGGSLVANYQGVVQK